MKMVLEIDDERFEAEGEFPLFVLEALAREAGLVEEDEELCALNRTERKILDY